jgi:FixJ family two-component response regulator
LSPIKAPKRKVRNPANMRSSQPSARPTVYVVDDDDAVCRAFAFALDLEDFRVEVCATGEALLMKNLPLHDAVLVVDERLPGVSGLDTLKALRARGVELPAILVTSHPKTALKAAAAAAGVPVLEKPLMGETLVAAIRKGLAAAHARSN